MIPAKYSPETLGKEPSARGAREDLNRREAVSSKKIRVDVVTFLTGNVGRRIQESRTSPGKQKEHLEMSVLFYV